MDNIKPEDVVVREGWLQVFDEATHGGNCAYPAGRLAGLKAVLAEIANEPFSDEEVNAAEKEAKNGQSYWTRRLLQCGIRARIFKQPEPELPELPEEIKRNLWVEYDANAKAHNRQLIAAFRLGQQQKETK